MGSQLFSKLFLNVILKVNQETHPLFEPQLKGNSKSFLKIRFMIKFVFE